MTRRTFLALSLLAGWLAGGLLATAASPTANSRRLTAAGTASARLTRAAAANPRLPAIFADNMVLQRDKAAPVWGWADPGGQVTVSFRDQKKTATADADGKWMVRLDPVPAGGPYELTVSGKGAITLKNVLVGDVWICSGQSNMEFALAHAHNAKEAIAASANPMLRHFTLQKAAETLPQADCHGKWEEADPQNSPHFTAVGYFFGQKLQKELNVPIGLIHTSWGGTAIEAWTSLKVMQADADLRPTADAVQTQFAAYQAAMKNYQQDLAAAQREGKPAPKAPQPLGPRATTLYNGMIAPLVPYGVAGAIWYQGESNAGNAKLYRKQLPAMINNWREDFGQEMPFFIVSLANFLPRQPQPTDTGWARLREAQAMTAASVPKTGLAIAIDVGDAKDIHPRDKQTVGQRLALSALGIACGKNIVYSGPVYESLKVDGDKARLTFKHTGGGLEAKGDKLTGFAIAGEDKKFVWADATIDGNSVVVSSKDVARPVAVRYAWADNPECNLYNQEGLPAVPFRTDQW